MSKLIKLSILSLLVLTLYGCGGTYVKTSYAKQTMSIEQAFKHCEFTADDEAKAFLDKHRQTYKSAWWKAYDKCLYKQGYVEE